MRPLGIHPFTRSSSPDLCSFEDIEAIMPPEEQLKDNPVEPENTNSTTTLPCQIL